MDSSACRNLPVSGEKMQRSSSEREINCATNKPVPFYPSMDDTHLDPTERRNKALNEFFRDYMKRSIQIDCLRRSMINKQGTKPTPRIDVLDIFHHLITSIHRREHQLLCLSVMKHRPVHRRSKVKFPLPRNIRQIMEEESQNNLCQAVQGMHLSSEQSRTAPVI